MNAQDIKLTEDAIKELMWENSETDQQNTEIIRQAKEEIFIELKKDIEKTLKNNKITVELKKYQTVTKKFDILDAKISCSLYKDLYRDEKDSEIILWIMLSIINIPEDNKKYVVIIIPHQTSALIPIENLSFNLNELNFNKIFALQKYYNITPDVIKYIKQFTSPRPISDSSGKKARELFGGLMD